MNTTHTKELTEPSEKPKAGQFLETISLRDYFAAKAMQAFVEKYSHEGDISRNAYKVADAMMKARQS
jgi:hypothetical protein